MSTSYFNELTWFNLYNTCFLDGKKDTASYSKLQWPEPEYLTNDDLKVWRQQLHRTYTYPNSTRLRQAPSREWLPIENRNREWHCNVEVSNGLPSVIATGTRQFNVVKINRRTLGYQPTRRGPIRGDQIPAIMRVPFQWNRRSHIRMPKAVQEITRCELIVSDGSVKDGCGGFGAIVKNNQQLMEYCGRVEGDREKINSYRVEAGGASIMMVQKKIIPNAFFCDNKSVIQKMSQTKRLHPLAPEWDLLEPLRMLVEDQNVKCSHVKGHRDEEVEEVELRKIEKINILRVRLCSLSSSFPFCVVTCFSSV